MWQDGGPSSSWLAVDGSPAPPDLAHRPFRPGGIRNYSSSGLEATSAPERRSRAMTSVFANMTMSLDGFVSHPTDGASQIFQWYGAGPFAVSTAAPDLTFHTSQASARHLRAAFDRVGALVYGLPTFEGPGCRSRRD